MALIKGVDEPKIRKALQETEIGDLFGVKIKCPEFSAVFPYHTLQEANLGSDVLTLIFMGGVAIVIVGTNLEKLLDSLHQAKAFVIQGGFERPETSDGGDEIFIENIRRVMPGDE